MKFKDFLSFCTACGGNWGAMLLTGIKCVFPNEYENVENCYNDFNFSDGGIEAFGYLCNWLENHGIIIE